MDSERIGMQNWKDSLYSAVMLILAVYLVVSCLLLYNFARINELLYLGWVLIVAGILLFFSAKVLHEEGGVQEGKSYTDTTLLVDKGIYSIVRHPIYLSFMLGILGVILIGQNWLSLALGLPMLFAMYIDMCREEQDNLDKFGEAYRDYMSRVPRMNVFWGIYRRIQCQDVDDDRERDD